MYRYCLEYLGSELYFENKFKSISFCNYIFYYIRNGLFSIELIYSYYGDGSR